MYARFPFVQRLFSSCKKLDQGTVLQSPVFDKIRPREENIYSNLKNNCLNKINERQKVLSDINQFFIQLKDAEDNCSSSLSHKKLLPIKQEINTLDNDMSFLCTLKKPIKDVNQSNICSSIETITKDVICQVIESTNSFHILKNADSSYAPANAFIPKHYFS